MLNTEPLFVIPLEVLFSCIHLSPLAGTQNVLGCPFGVIKKDHFPSEFTVITTNKPSSTPCSVIFSSKELSKLVKIASRSPQITLAFTKVG